MNEIIEMINMRILELYKFKIDDKVARIDELITLKAKLVEVEKSNADK